MTHKKWCICMASFHRFFDWGIPSRERKREEREGRERRRMVMMRRRRMMMRRRRKKRGEGVGTNGEDCASPCWKGLHRLSTHTVNKHPHPMNDSLPPHPPAAAAAYRQSGHHHLALKAPWPCGWQPRRQQAGMAGRSAPLGCLLVLGGCVPAWDSLDGSRAQRLDPRRIPKTIQVSTI